MTKKAFVFPLGRLLSVCCALFCLLIATMHAQQPDKVRSSDAQRKEATGELIADTLVRSAVEAKLLAWRARRAKNCRDKALKEAEQLADSLMVEFVRRQKATLAIPPRPVRPPEPPLRRPADTLELKPFLEEN